METELIERTRQGDSLAFQTLIDHHREAVFRLAFLMLRQEEDAEDITQEVFWRAYQNLGRFDTTRPLRPWLLRITANLCRNRRRDLGRYWAALNRFLRQEPDQVVSAERQHVQAAEVEAVLEAVRHLNGPEQEIIYLRYFMGLSIEETADTLGVRPGTVKSRLHRALYRLTGIIERQFPILTEERRLS